MSRVLKGLAIAALLVTVIGAGAVLYGVTMFAPRVESISVTVTPAVQVREAFDAVLGQVASGTFTGRLFGETEGLSAEECTFLTFTVRLTNKGFFPAEWLSIAVTPAERADSGARDVLQLGDDGAYVLAQGATGDMAATILCVGDASDTKRQLIVTSYVFGGKTEVTALSE